MIEEIEIIVIGNTYSDAKAAAIATAKTKIADGVGVTASEAHQPDVSWWRLSKAHARYRPILAKVEGWFTFELREGRS